MDEVNDTKRRIVNTIINKVISLLNKDIDIEHYQKKFGATKGKIIQGRLKDIDRTFFLQIKNGEIKRLHDPGHVDGWFETDCATLINLFRGKIKVVNPSTMEEREIEYSPIDAVRYGEISVKGDASSNDLLLFATSIYHEAYPQVRGVLNGEFKALVEED